MTIEARKIAAAVNRQTEENAILVYTGLRIALAEARAKKDDIAANLMKVMKMAGDALEARIGEDRFEALLDEIDGNLYA